MKIGRFYFSAENHRSFLRRRASSYSYSLQLVLKGAFFWNYSGIGILGIDGICVLLGVIPDSRMNRMEGIRFTRNRQNTRSLFWENFWRKILRGRSRQSRLAGMVVPRSPPPWVFRFQIWSVLFEIGIPCILLFLNRNKNS